MNYFRNIRREYSNTFRIVATYFHAYGGWSALRVSVYVQAACLLNLLMFSTWTTAGWWDIPLSVLPNVIGFSLGGYAILLGFGDEKFRNALKGSTNGQVSPFLAVSATFVHFIFVQIAALLFALVAKGRLFSSAQGDVAFLIDMLLTPNSVNRRIVVTAFWALGFGTFLYAIFLTIAATFGVFRLSTWLHAANAPALRSQDPELTADHA